MTRRIIAIPAPLALLFALFAAVVALADPAAAKPKPADIIVWGGPIYTGEDGRGPVEALAVRDGVVAAAGARRSVARLQGPGTEVIDLRGAAAFPGFTDAHVHLQGVGARELTFNLDTVTSLADLVARVKARAAGLKPGDVLVGRGWIETHWPEARFPTRRDLDAVAPDIAVILERADGHALVANSAALTRAGIDAKTTPPSGGDILKEPDGAPSGMLIDNAMDLMGPVIAAAPRPTVRESLAATMRVYPARGWTGAHNMSVDWAEMLALEALDAEGGMKLRVYNAVTPQASEKLFASGPRRSPDGLVSTRAIKFYADGALGSRGAALFEPYADSPGSRGLVLLRAEDADPLFARALKDGIQIATHGIGDRGNAIVLDAYARAFAAVPPAQRAIAAPRWRVEHAQVLRLSDIPRFKEMGVIASMQPSHAIGDLYFAPARLGPTRLDGAYAWRSLLESGAVIAGGSDAPVEQGDPLIEFYAATARRALNGFQGPDWRPQEAVSRAQALAMFTTAPAYTAFEEKERGRLVKGARADVSIFSVDLMTAPLADIPKGRALATIVDGKIAYRADGW
ncbi:MAG: amidohydrolase [Alphaproteobacteria bacterium]|nr:amidohydrolase [Alphaproteobacteria bacterium]